MDINKRRISKDKENNVEKCNEMPNKVLMVYDFISP